MQLVAHPKEIQAQLPVDSVPGDKQLEALVRVIRERERQIMQIHTCGSRQIEQKPSFNEQRSRERLKGDCRQRKQLRWIHSELAL